MTFPVPGEKDGIAAIPARAVSSALKHLESDNHDYVIRAVTPPHLLGLGVDAHSSTTAVKGRTPVTDWKSGCNVTADTAGECEMM
jgi:hypothetical protein